jgi:hypothetical protein
MLDQLNLASMSKAIAGGLVSAIVLELGRYGFHPGPEVITAAGVVGTAVVGYVIGHLVVFLAPANRAKSL